MIAFAGETKLITPAEAARIAGVTRETIRVWLKLGKLTEYKRKLDGRKMVDEEELLGKLSGTADNDRTGIQS